MEDSLLARNSHKHWKDWADVIKLYDILSLNPLRIYHKLTVWKGWNGLKKNILDGTILIGVELHPQPLYYRKCKILNWLPGKQIQGQ